MISIIATMTWVIASESMNESDKNDENKRQRAKKNWAQSGIEPETSRTLSEHNATILLSPKRPDPKTMDELFVHIEPAKTLLLCLDTPLDRHCVRLSRYHPCHHDAGQVLL